MILEFDNRSEHDAYLWDKIFNLILLRHLITSTRLVTWYIRLTLAQKMQLQEKSDTSLFSGLERGGGQGQGAERGK